MTSYKNIMEKIERDAKEAYGNVNMVDSPPHYNNTEIECIEAIAAATGDGFEYYLQGNIMKLRAVMMMRVKMFLTLDVDPEEYPVPADENVAEELEESLQEYLYDIEGINIRNIRTIQE